MTHEATPELPDDVLALLGDESVWAEFDESLENDTVAAVMAEVSAVTTTTTDTGTGALVMDLAERRSLRRKSALLGAAAALLIVACGFVVASVAGGGGQDFDISLALVATDVEPGASGRAEVTATPDGTRIVIDTNGLPPAPGGSYYEAWLRTGADFGVSAGTFHLRGGGDRSIELWAGVTIEEFPLFTITLQPAGMEESSGVVVLAARFDG